MSITIEINEKQLNSEENNLNVQFLPAKINGDGVASVDKYFAAYTRDDNGLLSNSLRGYPLLGEKAIVPEGFRGVVLQETRKPLDEEAERVLRIKGSFKEFTYWNYDKMPSNSDGYKQAVKLLELAECLALPITEEEVLSEMQKSKKSA